MLIPSKINLFTLYIEVSNRYSFMLRLCFLKFSLRFGGFVPNRNQKKDRALAAAIPLQYAPDLKHIDWILKAYGFRLARSWTRRIYDTNNEGIITLSKTVCYECVRLR